MRSGSWLLICWWVLKLSLALGMGLTTLSAHAAPDECHGQTAAQTEVSQSDNAHCTSQDNCHLCCPLVWGNGPGMHLHATPNIHPSGHMADWYSASWVPDLRPPIA